MSRYFQCCRVLLAPSLLGAAFIALPQLDAVAQDAQADAQAKVARDKAQAERVANTPLPATREKDEVAAPKPGDLNKRAGEQIGGSPRGKSVVYGMYVQEADNGRVKVIEVGAATPAYDAGIREGDELVSFKEFKADSYRKWIDGIAKVASSAPDGSMLPIVVLRQGKQVATEIRVPAGRNAPLQLPIGPPPVGQQPQQGDVGINVNETNINVLGTNNGAFGAFFQDEASRGTERAMAQLTRVGNPQPVADPAPKLDVGARGEVGANWSAKPVPPTANNRIGLAGFRNDANGMVVMVDVGALEPGNYVVGIGDPNMAGPQPAPAPATSIQQPSPPQATAGAPASGAVRPISTPASGQVNPSSATATGQSAANIGLAASAEPATPAAGASSPMFKEIGTLTVDQSGTGRLQQVVEGVQVRDVVGQAIVLHAQASANQKTLPPNLDPSADPAGPAKSDAAGQPSAGSPVAADGGPQPRVVGRPTSAAAEPAQNGSAPVAAGVIRLMSDHQPAANSAPIEGEGFGPASATPQPASKAPAVPQRAVR